MLDQCVDYRFLTDAQARPALETLSRVVAMLIRLIQSLNLRQDAASSPRYPINDLTHAHAHA